MTPFTQELSVLVSSDQRIVFFPGLRGLQVPPGGLPCVLFRWLSFWKVLLSPERNYGLGSGSEEAVGQFKEKSCRLSTS